MKHQLLFFIVINVLCVNISFAHGDLHERILEITETIDKYPDSAHLYVKRGKLYFQHEAYKKSIKDLRYSERLGFHSIEQQLLHAKNYFRLEKYKEALYIIDKALHKDANNVKFLKLKAQVYFKLEQYHNAAISFEAVIKHSSQKLPENFIDASLAWVKVDKPWALEQSKVTILNGIKILGQLVSLYNTLITIAINQKDFDYAIAMQKEVIKISHRKETAYYRLYELQMLNGNTEKAIDCLESAKAHIKKLPERFRNTKFILSLADKIDIEEKKLLTN